ncbi:MAG: H+-translocating transhydrogenase subunit beta, partial [Microbacteriaceae bacterium]|nr:H+-translocating transhydrogenase subunit beta [Microbacteriaceae bacterium]
MTTLEFAIGAAYLAAAVLFVVGLHLMRAPSTARRGNLISAGGMVVAVLATVVFALLDAGGSVWAWIALLLGLLAGGSFGVVRARTVKMTDIPQLVSLFNAVGGGAAAAVAFADFVLHLTGATLGLTSLVPIVLDVLIGSVTFSGSLIASGKLQGVIPSRPLSFPGARVVNVAAVVVALGAGVLS